MKVNFEIIFDDDMNYFHRETPPAYVYDVLAHMKNVSLDEMKREYPKIAQLSFDYPDITTATMKDVLDRLIHKMGLQPEQLHLLFVFSIFQGEIWREGQIKYYMQSHESDSHNNPHVHVNIGHKYEASIDIINGNILAGKVPQKYYGKIIKKIKDNKDFLILCWNELTDGLKIDINYGLGIASYQ